MEAIRITNPRVANIVSSSRSILARVYARDVIIVALIVLLCFENILQARVSSIFAYMDEAVAVVMIIWVVICRYNERLHLNSWVYFVLGFCTIGLVGNACNQIQAHDTAIVIDAVTCMKFFVSFWAASYVIDTPTYAIVRACQIFVKAFFAIALFCAILEQLVGIGMAEESRMGLRSFMFLFGHPSSYASTIVAMCAFLLIDQERNRLALIVGVVLLVWSTRFKAIGAAVVLVLVMTLFRDMKRITPSFIIVSVASVLVFSSSQISVYMFNDETARMALHNAAVTTANNFFPLGTGFAGFGSNITRQYYPEYYAGLGFGDIYGLSESNSAYLADTFWPIVIGQFGWLGLVVFLIALALLLRRIEQERQKWNASLWAAYYIPIYLVITSTSEPAFFNHYAVLFAIAMVVILRCPQCSIPDLDNEEANVRYSRSMLF